VPTVAVFSDADVGAPHVALADEAIRIGPPPVKESYLAVDALVAAIHDTGADAVHPGYGLLSESAAFAEAVTAAGAVFVGPSPSALRALGDKIAARQSARAVGLEPPPGSDGPIDPADRDTLHAEAARIGFPVLVKAAAGGGGIGMQVASTESELESAARTAADRSRSAFLDDRVYLERYLERPRHIELQLVRDAHGGAAALGERECSVQRRHQKVIEESPSPASFLQGEAGAARRRELSARALALFARVDYQGVGTVEFVADAAGALYFLEVNARLQVEHPVTELVTGLDLVELQLRVAAGETLPPALASLSPRGHAVEMRLYAEDPAKGFLPQPGKLARLRFPLDLPGVRVDAGYEEGGEVTPHYDPLIAKIAGHGSTRPEAIARLVQALAGTEIELVGPRGPRTTNIDCVRRVLANEAFLRGDYDTGILPRLMAKGQPDQAG